MSSELHKALETIWTTLRLNGKSLNDEFIAFGGTSPCLHETQALAGQSFPYCVYEVETDSVRGRMTGHTPFEHHKTVDVPVTFRIYAKQANSQSSKSIAIQLKNTIKNAFGEHPTQGSPALDIDNGTSTITQLVSEFGLKEEDDIYLWSLSYVFVIDSQYQV